MQIYANFLFWVLWACLAMHIQSYSIKLYKTFTFICIPKINFAIHFFLEILQFKESCNMITISIILAFTLDDSTKNYCQIFQKIRNKAILSPFCLNLGKNEFSWKKGLRQFLNILIIYHSAKNQKKLMTHSWEKCRTDRQKDRHWWFCRTLRRTGVQ